MPRKSLAAIFVAAALVGAACGSDNAKTATTTATTCGVTTTGVGYCWGYGDYGELAASIER